MKSLFSDFEPVRPQTERLFLTHCFWVIPTVYIFRSYVIWLNDDCRCGCPACIPYNLCDIPKTFAELLLILAVLMSAWFFTQLGPKLQELFRSPAMVRKEEGPDADSLIKVLDQNLNCGKRVLVGGLFAAGILIYYGSKLFIPENAYLSFLGYLDLVLFSVPTSIYLYFVGTLVWRFAITISFINRLPKSFEIRPVLFHPDKAAGLDSVGYLSMRMLFVFSVPTIASAFALLTLLTPVVNSVADFHIPEFNQTAYFFVVPSVLLISMTGILFGLMPVRAVLTAGKHNLDEWNDVREIASDRIIGLKRRCLELTEDEVLDSGSGLEQMKYLETVYATSKNTSWPLSRDRIKGVVALLSYYFSQLAALWGVVAGIFKSVG